MNLIPDSVRSWAGQNPLRMIFGVAAFLCTVALFGSRLDWLKSHFDNYVRAGTRVGQSSQIEVYAWFFVVYFLGIVLVLTGGALIGRSLQKAETQSGRASLQLVQKFLDAAAIIKDRSFPQAADVPYALKNVKSANRIQDDFSGHVIRELVVKAVHEPVDFFPVEIGVSGEAEPMEYLDGLDLRVEPEDSLEVAVLPTFLDKYRKQFLLVFLPRIEPGSERKLTICYSWKGMWNELKSGQEIFEWTFKSIEQIPSLELSVLFPPGMPISCKVSSNHPGGRLEPVLNNENEVCGFKYLVSDGPKDISTYKLIVKHRDSGQAQIAAPSQNS